MALLNHMHLHLLSCVYTFWQSSSMVWGSWAARYIHFSLNVTMGKYKCKVFHSDSLWKQPYKYCGGRQRSKVIYLAPCLSEMTLCCSILAVTACHLCAAASSCLMESDMECSSPERQCALSSSHCLSVRVSWVNPGLRLLCQPDEQPNRSALTQAQSWQHYQNAA